MEQIEQVVNAPPEPAHRRRPGEPVSWPDPAAVIEQLKGKVSQVAGKEPAWLLVYTDSLVAWGRVENDDVSSFPEAESLLCPRYLLEVRLFGQLGEWHVWRHKTEFRGRLRVDPANPSANIIEERQALWGTRAINAPIPGWTVVEEDRGARMCVPHIGFSVQPDRPLRLQVRHYLRVEEKTHLTTIIDSRLVALCDSSGSALQWPDKSKEAEDANKA